MKDQKQQYGACGSRWHKLTRGAIAFFTAVTALNLSDPAFADRSGDPNTYDPNIEPEYAGLCAMENERPGRWITRSSGEIIPLSTLCTHHQLPTDDADNANNPNDDASDDANTRQAVSTSAPAQTPQASEIDLSNETNFTPAQVFWSRFLQVASPEAIAFSHYLDRSAVVEYGQTICPLLNTGTSMDEIRITQIEAGLPPDFDAAINVSAIHTYCPEHEGQIGR